jgi:hypothetical protein
VAFDSSVLLHFMRDPARRKTWMRKSMRRRMIRFFYDLTEEQFAAQQESQGGGCAFCGFVPPSGKYLSIDHAHDQHEHVGTKRGCPQCIRGLLCQNCNRSVLPVLERNEQLQNDFVKAYLKQRPFWTGRDGVRFSGGPPSLESGSIDDSRPRYSGTSCHGSVSFKTQTPCLP